MDSVLNLVSLEYDVHYNAIRTLMCNPGFVFDDETTTRTLSCTEDGRWSSELESCQGTHRSVVKYLMLSLLFIPYDYKLYLIDLNEFLMYAFIFSYLYMQYMYYCYSS